MLFWTVVVAADVVEAMVHNHSSAEVGRALDAAREILKKKINSLNVRILNNNNNN
jgi:hypothetical protein